MILEGIITTQDADGSMHVAPIGPHVDRELASWSLKPFQTSTTFANLYRHNHGVFHVVDDGLLLVRSVLGICNTPEGRPQAELHADLGWILKNACRAYPLHVIQWDTTQDRAVATCLAKDCFEIRPFWGWNRANHSLLELAVLWSRRHLITKDVLLAEFERNRSIVQKTAGDRELSALDLLEIHLREHMQSIDQ